jgi:hypothetical protein
METPHRPDPEFVANLEWQVRTALRREDRFSAPTRQGKGGRMKLASVVLVSALLGASGVVVTGEVQEGRAQQVRLARVETELRRAELELQFVRSQLEQMEEQAEAGVVGQQAVLSGRLAIRQATAHVQTLEADRDEIRLTGRDPRNDVSAPLVDGRDFVTERLRLQASVLEDRRELMEHQLRGLRELQAQGTIQADDVREGAFAVQEAQLQLDVLLERVYLRESYLSGELRAAQAEIQAELLEANRDLDFQGLAREIAVLRLHRLEEQAEAGNAHELEVERARLEVMQLELAEELIRLRLEELRGGR